MAPLIYAIRQACLDFVFVAHPDLEIIDDERPPSFASKEIRADMASEKTGFPLGTNVIAARAKVAAESLIDEAG